LGPSESAERGIAMQNNETTDLHAQYVRQTVESGVPPLELRYTAINDCYSKMPVAYRTATFVNSVVMGVLRQEEFSFATNVTETGVRLAKWNILEAVRHLEAFANAGRHVEWISVRCPIALAMNVDLYEWMQAVIAESGLKDPSKLCLEFPQSLLFCKESKARLSVLDMKLLKVRTMLSGVGGVDCPTARLTAIPVDMALLDEATTALTNDRNKPNVVPTMVQYLKSMRVDVIANGVSDDDQIRTLNRAECIGYTTAKDYRGTTEQGARRMTLAQAIEQREEEKY